MRITLDHPHTHAGVDHDAGAALDVSAIDADWLIAQRVGHTTTTTESAAAVADATATTGEHDDV